MTLDVLPNDTRDCSVLYWNRYGLQTSRPDEKVRLHRLNAREASRGSVAIPES
jgi:hypothetical protein